MQNSHFPTTKLPDNCKIVIHSQDLPSKVVGNNAGPQGTNLEEQAQTPSETQYLSAANPNCEPQSGKSSYNYKLALADATAKGCVNISIKIFGFFFLKRGNSQFRTFDQDTQLFNINPSF